MTNEKAILAIIIAALCTFLTRAIPFILFGGKREMSPFLKQLANTLPLAMIAVLVVYCLKDTVNQNYIQNIVTFVSCIVVCILHWIKGNTLLSLSVGTIIYMAGLQIFCI